MTSKKITLSVFFPARNEEGNIAQAVDDAIEVLENRREVITDYEVIVVDDGSTDKTGEIVDEIATKNSKVRVIHHEKNQGYGAAVWTGIQNCRYEYFFFTDSDLQFKLEEIDLLLNHIADYDIVIGYRKNRQDHFMRLVNAWGWKVLNRIVFGLKVKDVDCAFKLIKTALVKDLPIESRGAMFSAEMLVRLMKKGYKFKEVPVTHLRRLRGVATGAKLSVIFRAFKELVQVYRHIV